MKKYSELLSKIALYSRKEEMGKILDDFLNILKREGFILQAEAIVGKAKQIAFREIKESTATLKISPSLQIELKNEVKNQIVKVMKKEGKEEIFIEEIVDPDLIYGIEAYLPGRKIDSSLSGRIKDLSIKLKN